MYGESECSIDKRFIKYVAIVGIAVFCIYAVVVMTITMNRTSTISKQVNRVINNEINGMKKTETKRMQMYEQSDKQDKVFIRISGDFALKNIVNSVGKATGLYVLSKQEETKQLIKKKVNNDAESSKDLSEIDPNETIDSLLVYDLSSSKYIPTEFGFISAFDEKLTQIYIGAAPLIEAENNKSFKIKAWKIFHDLPENSKIYKFGKTSSCLVKNKKHNQHVMDISSKSICHNDFETPDTVLFLPNRGEASTIQFEHMCEINHNMKTPTLFNKNIHYYSNIKQIMNDTSTIANKNDLYIIPLTSYMEHKDKFEEVKIDSISCLDPTAPLSSDAFIFSNKNDETTKILITLFKQSIENESSYISKNGLVEYNFEQQNGKSFYPSINE